MTYTAGLLTQQVQGDTQTQAGANKKPGEEQGSIVCIPQKMPPIGSKPLCVGRHSPLGRTKSMLLSGMGSVHTIVAAVMTSVTKQDKLHLVPVPWKAHGIKWPPCHLSRSHIQVRVNLKSPCLHCPVLRITQHLQFCLFSRILELYPYRNGWGAGIAEKNRLLSQASLISFTSHLAPTRP